MARVNNLLGMKFGFLTVLSRAGNSKAGSARWACVCTCGRETVATGTALVSGGTKSCGKGHSKKDDLVGRVFGRLTVVESLGTARDFGGRGGSQVVRAICLCGGEWRGRAGGLKRGNTKSCGCLPHGIKPQPDREASALRALLRNYQRHAIRRKHVWELTSENFETLIRRNCYYCGSPPSSVCRKIPRGPRKTGSAVTYNGLDRKDNALGYTAQNVVPCCAHCNYSKRTLSAQAFLDRVRVIYLKHFGSNHG